VALLSGSTAIGLLWWGSRGFGSPSARLALALGAGLAVALVAVTAWTRDHPAGLWGGLAVLGQGAFAALTLQGSGIAYQHLRPAAEWTSDGVGIVALGLVGLQAIALATLGRAGSAGALRWLVKALGKARCAFLAVAFVLSSAVLAREVPLYLAELVLASTLQALSLGCVVLAGITLSAPTAERWRLGAPQLLDARFLPLAVAVWVFGVCALLSWAVYQHHPHVPDEVVYLIHARMLAAGHWDLPLPPVPAAFELDLFTYTSGRWYSPVPPGWPAFLSLGVRLGVPWLVNPLLGGLSVLLAHGVVRRLYSDRAAGVVTLLLGASPWFLFMNMSLMTHSLTLLAVLVAAYGTARWANSGSLAWTLPAGVGLGVVALNRPLEGLIAAGVCGLWALARGDGSFQRRVAGTSVMAAASAAVVSLTLPYNRWFTGSALRFPIMAYTDELYGPGSNALGFGPDRGLGWSGLDPFPGHGPLDVGVNTALNTALVNTELLGWATGSVLIVLIVLLLGTRKAADWAVLASAAAVVGAHGFYWFSGGPDFGARYWYLALVPLLILAGRGLIELGGRVGAPGRVWASGTLLLVSALVVGVPWRAVDKYYGYRGMVPDIRRLAQDLGWGANDVVLVRGERHPDYASAAVYNPLDLSGPGPLYVWDRDAPTRAALVQAYPGRRFWRVDGPTRTGEGFEVVGEWNPNRERPQDASRE